MKKIFLALFLLTSITASFSSTCLADARVYAITNPHPEEVLEALRKTYGDDLHANIARGQLVVVGSKRQLDEIGALLVKLDPAPRPLHLTLSERPPTDTTANETTYSSGSNTDYAIDTVEGAFVTVDYEKVTQQPQTNGWMITIDNKPTAFKSLTLRINIEGGRHAIVLVSYAKEENQERHIFSNTVVGDLGRWIPLLPQPATPSADTVSSGAKPGNQLYLRINKAFNN